jgi:HNH endonuclease
MKTSTWLKATVDHITPKAEGGTDDPANLRAC